MARRPRLRYPDQAAPHPFKGIERTIAYAANPKLLGLVYDERMSFVI